jgi:hypothetical protein
MAKSPANDLVVVCTSSKMTLCFKVADSIAHPVTPAPGVTNPDAGGNHVPDRKSFPLNDNRFENPSDSVLHLSRCPA